MPTNFANHIHLSMAIVVFCFCIVSTVLFIIVQKNNRPLKYPMYSTILGSLNFLFNYAVVYLVTNVPSMKFNLVLSIYIGSMPVLMLQTMFLCLFINDVIGLARSKYINTAFIILCLFELIIFIRELIFVPLKMYPETMIFEFSFMNKIVIIMAHANLLYTFIMGIALNRRIRDIRYRKMVRALMFILLVFFPGIFQALLAKLHSINFTNNVYEKYLFTMPLYLVWSLVSIYYLTKYFIVPARNEISDVAPSDKFVAEYNISSREKEIIKLLSNGYTNQDISEELSIKVGTVKAHIHKIFFKTGAKNRTELLSIVIFER